MSMKVSKMDIFVSMQLYIVLKQTLSLNPKHYSKSMKNYKSQLASASSLEGANLYLVTDFHHSEMGKRTRISSILHFSSCFQIRPLDIVQRN